jgi:hypothetical protein
MFNPFYEIVEADVSDGALAEQAKNGDLAALEKLVLRHQGTYHEIEGAQCLALGEVRHRINSRCHLY